MLPLQFGAWTLLSSVVFYVLKDAAERGRLAASTFQKLKLGVVGMAVSHLALFPARAILEPGLPLYPGFWGCGYWSLLSAAAYALALAVALRKDDK